MTGGVVLATLLLNATTIGPLIHRLGLDTPSRPDRFLAAVARLQGAQAARRRLAELGVEDRVVAARLDDVEGSARGELEHVELSPEEELEVVTRQGLFVERQTYQRLSDLGLLQPTAARTVLHEVDDQIEELGVRHVALQDLGEARPQRSELVVQRFAARIPRPVGEDPDEIAFAEAMARRVAARRTREALALFDELPNVSPSAVEGAREVFAQREREAERMIGRLDARSGDGDSELHRRIADALTRVAAHDALAELTDVGLLSDAAARGATQAVSAPSTQR